MNYEHIKTVATDWSVSNYYKLPNNRKFTVGWNYSVDNYDFNHTPHHYAKETKTVMQNACYAVVTTRRDDGSFFTFDVLDENMVTIRGKHCKGNSMYMQIYNELVGSVS